MLFLIFIIVLIWLLFCLFSGNPVTMLGIPIIGAIFLMYKNGIDYLFPFILLPFLTLFVLDIFAWRELFFKPKIWKKIEYLPSIIATISVIAIDLYYKSGFLSIEKDDFFASIAKIVFVLGGTFGLTKMFITDLLFFLLNRLKVIEKTKVIGKIERVERKYESKAVVYYIHLDDKSERVRINLLCVLYLNFFVKNKTVEFEFKRGFLGLEYCDKLPKILKQ